MTAMEKEPKKVYGLLVTTKEDHTFSKRDLTVTLTAVRIEEGRKLRNPSSSYNEEPLADFRITGYVYQDSEHTDAHYKFHDVYAVSMQDCERMLKVYRKLEKGLQTMRDKLGWAETFGGKVARIANVLGIDSIIFYSRDQPIRSGYDDNAFHFLGIGDGASRLDNDIYQWKRVQKEANQPAQIEG